MKLYVVSCDKGREERLLKKAVPLHLDIEIVESFHANDPLIEKYAKRVLDKNHAYPSYPTGVAATMGHMKAMKRFLETNQSFCMIGEDDIRFDKYFNEKLAVIMKFIGDSDIVTLGGCSDTVPVGDVIDMDFMEMKMVKNAELGNPWGAQLYIISQKYANYFLNRFFHIPSLDYDYKFVTDCVIFDPRYCIRFSLLPSIAIEDPEEQTIAGNINKMSIAQLGVKKENFYF
jgi:GR25 family glycosyltransferase involved in LPS biosynthesis